jgi:predicted nucleotidyltransferase
MELKTVSTLADLQAQRDSILALAARYGASDVRVMGSAARGEATAESDIDLVVCFQEWVTLLDHSALRLELIALLGHDVDVISDHSGLSQRFRDRIQQEAVRL